MISIVLDGKTKYINSTPIMCFVESERNLTLAKIVIDGKQYEIRINANGKAQMT